jgi:hypothetical protein
MRLTTPPPPDLKHQDQPYLTRPVTAGRTLAVVPWGTLLSRLETAVTDADDVASRADLRQLSGLVAWRSRSGWVPIVPGDLPERAGRQIVGLRDAVIKAAQDVSTLKTRNGTGDNGPGRWITTRDGKSIWVGILFPEWGKYGITPVWLFIEPSASTNSTQLQAALQSLNEPGGPGLFPRANGWTIPLTVPLGAEQGEAAASLRDQMQHVAALVDVSHVNTSDVSPQPDQ